MPFMPIFSRLMGSQFSSRTPSGFVTLTYISMPPSALSLKPAFSPSLSLSVCQLEYEQSVARTRVDYVTAAEGVVARVEQHHVIHRKGTH